MKGRARGSVTKEVMTIVHGLRGPLGALAGFVHLLYERENLSPAARKDYRIMLGLIDCLLKMTDSILQAGEAKRGRRKRTSARGSC